MFCYAGGDRHRRAVGGRVSAPGLAGASSFDHLITHVVLCGMSIANEPSGSPAATITPGLTGGSRRRPCAARFTESSPGLHELAALLQGIAAAVGLFSLIANDVRERGLSDLPRKAGYVAGPVPEA
jgi:hypothetical protein